MTEPIESDVFLVSSQLVSHHVSSSLLLFQLNLPNDHKVTLSWMIFPPVNWLVLFQFSFVISCDEFSSFAHQLPDFLSFISRTVHHPRHRFMSLKYFNWILFFRFKCSFRFINNRFFFISLLKFDKKIRCFRLGN